MYNYSQILKQAFKVAWQNPGLWFFGFFVALVIGVFVGIVFDFDPRLWLLAGYAGTDILEGIYKSFMVQKVYVGAKKIGK